MSNLSEENQKVLLEVAKEAIGHMLNPDINVHPHKEKGAEELHKYGASFVTLTIDGRLRGCIGSLEPYRPLIDDVVGNAISAAFADPRFSPITKHEWKTTKLSISVLSPREVIEVESEEDLLQKLRPGIDGLVITSDWRAATFLPSVWEELPTPIEFLRHLKQKAGMDPNEWPENIKVERYTTLSFS